MAQSVAGQFLGQHRIGAKHGGGHEVRRHGPLRGVAAAQPAGVPKDQLDGGRPGDGTNRVGRAAAAMTSFPPRQVEAVADEKSGRGSFRLVEDAEQKVARFDSGSGQPVCPGFGSR